MGESALEVARRLRGALVWVDLNGDAATHRGNLWVRLYPSAAGDLWYCVLMDGDLMRRCYHDEDPGVAMRLLQSWAAGYARDLAALAGLT